MLNTLYFDHESYIYNLTSEHKFKTQLSNNTKLICVVNSKANFVSILEIFNISSSPFFMKFLEAAAKLISSPTYCIRSLYIVQKRALNSIKVHKLYCL